jgi:hypothetical protein
MLSPPGDYLADAVSFSSGVCHVSSSVWIADLSAAGKERWTHVSDIDPQVRATPLRWENGDRLVLRKPIYEGVDTCGEHRGENNVISAQALHFPELK